MMNEQNVPGNVTPAQPESREPSFSDLYKEESNADQEQEEPEEEPGETRGKRPRVSRLERLEQKKAQIEHQMKALHARESEKERKVRTRRLIQIGALSEKYFNCEGIEPGHYEELLKKLVAVESVKGILKRKCSDLG